MKIGIVVDGQSEVVALPTLYPRLSTKHELLKPIFADMQQYSTAALIAKSVEKRIQLICAKRATGVIVLVDREKRIDCPGAIAASLCAELSARLSNYGFSMCAVVVKDRAFENWLIADPTAFQGLTRRFSLKAGRVRSINAGSADTVDACNVLREAAMGTSYSKTVDAPRILAKASPSAMAANSRSFRKFAKEIA